jgi:hypothetical protein
MSVAHVDKDGRVWFLGELGQAGVIETVGERHGGALVHELEAVEAGDLSGVQERTPLGVRSVARHRDDTVVHLRVEVGLGDALQLDQKRAHDLLGRELTRLVHVVHLEVDPFVVGGGGGGGRRGDSHRLIRLLDWHLRVVELARQQALEVADRVGAVRDLLLLGRVTLETLRVCVGDICSTFLKEK